MYSRAFLLLFLGLFLTTSFVVKAQEDGKIEDEVEGEGAKPVEPEVKDTKEEDDSPRKIGPSPDAQATIYFVEPVEVQDITAGKLVSFLIGFANKGEKDFIVHFTEPSFRYPMDFSYSMLNLTAARHERTVAPKQEATFDYRFIPSDAFIGRPVGFVVNLHYTDAAGGYYVSTVFNETITVQEDESSLNTETIFLFVLLTGLVVLLLLVGHHYLSKFTHKRPGTYQVRQETGTTAGEVDFDWIPKEYINQKSPKTGASPRNRRRPAKVN